MREAFAGLLAIGMVAMVGMCRPAAGGERQIALREYVGRQWTNELLSYPFEAAEGACHVDGVRLQGPDGAMPVQFSEVEYWPGTRMVKSATLWLVADLAPLTTNEYAVVYGAEPAEHGQGDLGVTAAEDEVEMTTSGFGARLRLGAETFDEPRAAADVPGPVVALRLADGTWFGGSRLFGEARLKGWSAELVAVGPVYGQVEYTYEYEDGNAVRLTTRLHEGAAGLYWEVEVAEDLPEEGIEIVLSDGLPPLTLVVHREAYGDRPEMEDVDFGTWVEIPLADYGEELVTNLSPWADWWNTWTQTLVRLRIGEQERELHLASHDPGAWVEPAAPGTMRDWGAWQHKLVPVKHSPAGEVSLHVNHAAGVRKWSIEDRDPAHAEERRMSLSQVKAEWPPLNEVKDWILEWPGDERTHPHLFVSRGELEAAWERLGPEPDPDIEWLRDYLSKEEIRPVPSYKDTQAVEVYVMTRGDAKAAEKVRLVDRVRQHMAALGDFDKMRSTQTVAALYDLTMGTDLLTDQEMDLFRSQMAFLGYIVARPSTWNIERGYRSYNPNMSLSYLLARGIVGCAIPDHPLAQEWVAPGLSRAQTWLGEVGPEGEWYESAHYSQVSAFAMTSFAAAAKRAGFGDLFLDENLKKWAMWLAQIYTPRDPMEGRGNRRASPPIGRATAGVPWGLFGLMAKATVDTDPEYSRQMQWAWAGTDYTTHTASHLGGFEPIYMDPELPMEVPDWTSKLFPQVGPLCRSGVGDEHENYLALFANTGAGARLPELGSLALWFARGVPVAGAFPGGYKERYLLLVSRVIPALSWSEAEPWDESRFGCTTDVTMGDFSALPRQDYFTASYVLKGWDGGTYGSPEAPVTWPPAGGEARFPLNWRRRMLYVQDDDPGGTSYLLLRDSVSGAGPSLWQMWTVSDGLVTPEQAEAMRAVGEEGPGKTSVPAHPLEGDRLTALGQYGVDVEYYIADPIDTERWTMRWGHRYVDYAVQGEDYRDLLQLRLAGEGEYFVVMFPRFKEAAAPEFATLGGGSVIKITGDFGTDYCFLPAEKQQVTVDGARFRGKAGSVQDRAEGALLATAGASEVRYGAWGVSASHAASLRVGPDRLVVHLSYAHTNGGDVSLLTEGQWKAVEGQEGVTLTATANGCRLVLEPGVVRAELEPA